MLRRRREDGDLHRAPVSAGEAALGQEPFPHPGQVDAMSPVDAGPVQGVGGQAEEDLAREGVVPLQGRRGSFSANAAWTVLWAIAHNLTRAAGALASMFHARARTATIRAHLINVPARFARSARRLTLHLPEGWPWQAAWDGLHAAVHRQPAAITT